MHAFARYDQRTLKVQASLARLYKGSMKLARQAELRFDSGACWKLLLKEQEGEGKNNRRVGQAERRGSGRQRDLTDGYRTDHLRRRAKRDGQGAA